MQPSHTVAPEQLPGLLAEHAACGFGLPIVECRAQLEPGDRSLLCTDGIVEARDADGRQFGPGHCVDFIVRHHSGHRTPRRPLHAVGEHHAGRLDDVTVLPAEWRRPPGQAHPLTLPAPPIPREATALTSDSSAPGGRPAPPAPRSKVFGRAGSRDLLRGAP
ncbi:SpoIIE family protein phosphatase [Streptomyces sp. NPDC003697]